MRTFASLSTFLFASVDGWRATWLRDFAWGRAERAQDTDGRETMLDVDGLGVYWLDILGGE